MSRVLAFQKIAGPAAVACVAFLLSAGAAGEASGAPASARAASPRTVTAALITRTPGSLRRGTIVRSAALGVRVFPDARHGFALASVAQGEYPATTTNGGGTWRINGPVLHVDAAQAPLAVLDVGAVSRSTYFACCGAQVIDITSDGGKHWWQSLFSGLVMAVVSRGDGRLIAFTQGQASGSGVQAINRVYVSTDGGRHWHPDDRIGAF